MGDQLIQDVMSDYTFNLEFNQRMMRLLERAASQFDEIYIEPDGPELISALYNRDIEPLRAKYPHFAAFINFPPEPKRRRGERKFDTQRLEEDILIDEIVNDVRRALAMLGRRSRGRKAAVIEAALARWMPGKLLVGGKRFERLLKKVESRMKTAPSSRNRGLKSQPFSAAAGF